MGKSRRKIRSGRHKPNVWDQDHETSKRAEGKRWWANEISRTNPGFEKFYKELPITGSNEEFEQFMEAFRRPLPISFRLTGGSKLEVEKLKQVLHDRYLCALSESEQKEIDGHKVEPPTQVSWFPGGTVYQVTLPRAVIRKSALLNNFHNFLVTEGEVGNLSRQEVVSMIPPLFLDIQSDSKVLDMCAAPGSKTAQILELMQWNCQPHQVPEGFVIANDADNKRCYLLVHQALRRLQTPNIIVTNQDAGTFCHIFTTPPPGNGSKRQPLLYDRILCDVPCSGDGTVRKNVDIWKKWNPNTGYNLFKLQCRIGRRAVELLKPGGLMVYSTCSLNPAENEAVLVDLLEFGKGSLELVDEKAKELGLDRSFRILPHYHDTGGFFVGVLRKIAPLDVQSNDDNQTKSTQSRAEVTTDGNDPNEPIESNETLGSHPKVPRIAPENGVPEAGPQPSSTADQNHRANDGASTHRKRGRGRCYREDPFIFLKEGEPLWTPLKDYFGISEGFPYLQLLGRCEDDASKSKRNLYFVNKALKDIMTNNDPEKLRIINAGVRVFKRVEEKLGGFRLAQESVDFLLPYLSKRTYEVSVSDMICLLKGGKACHLENFSEELCPKLEQSEMGSIVLFCRLDSGQQYVVCGWKGAVSVAPYLAKELRLHLLRMFDVDTTDIEKDLMSTRKLKSGGAHNQTGPEPVEPVPESRDAEDDLTDMGEFDQGLICSLIG